MRTPDGPGPLAPTLATLAQHWREQARGFRRYGADAQAKVLETVAADLEDALRAEADVPLTLEEASTASGYSAEHLRHLVAAGTIPNAGKRGAPRIRRGDLPKRPAGGTPPATTPTPTRSGSCGPGDALALAPGRA